ncbi:hypothetical protein C8T65DRAFT_704876 [Cerioporus squamosus]|nr:hypothetical protein C8T65DRAFT_704876 [Cerioporus squamosus]
MLLVLMACPSLMNYPKFPPPGLFAYEYAITFGHEVELFWKRKITVSSMLFLVNRYIPLVVNMIYAPWPSYPTTYYILEIFQYLPWAVFSALRAYALTSGTRPLAGIVFFLALAPVVVNYVTLGYATPVVDPFFGCSASVSLSDATQQNFTIISRVCLITSDLVLMGITWFATYKTSREIKALNQVASLSSVLFRDGPVLAIMNVLHLSFSLLSILNQNASPNASYITILTEPITAILISRFLLDLQEANAKSMHQDSFGSIGTLDFNGMISSVSSHPPTPGEVCVRLGCADSSQFEFRTGA